MKYYTDYPFKELGDEEYKKAPIRKIEIISYDGNKYCKVKFEGNILELKSGYIYKKHGRNGEVENVSNWILKKYLGRDA